MMKTLSIGGLLLATFSTSLLAAPVINIGGMHEFMSGTSTTFVKRIHNNGDSTAFVRVTVSEIVKDANGKAVEKPVDSTAVMNKQASGVVASPARLIVPASGMQSGRLLYMGPRDKERLYRVRYIPVVPADKSEFGQTDKEFSEYVKKTSAQLTMLTGYGALLTVRPQPERYDTQIRDAGDRHIVRNGGNTTIILESFQECKPGLKNCAQPAVRYISPGKESTFIAKPGLSYRYELTEGKQKKKVSFGQK